MISESDWGLIKRWVKEGVLGHQEIIIPKVEPKIRWQVGQVENELFTTRISIRGDGRLEAGIYTSGKDHPEIIPFAWKTAGRSKTPSSNLRFTLLERPTIAAIPRHLGSYWARVDLGSVGDKLTLYPPKQILPAGQLLTEIACSDTLYRSVLLSVGQYGTRLPWRNYLNREWANLSPCVRDTIFQALEDWEEIRPKPKRSRPIL